MFNGKKILCLCTMSSRLTFTFTDCVPRLLRFIINQEHVHKQVQDNVCLEAWAQIPLLTPCIRCQ